MALKDILDLIDGEIDRLQQAKAVLSSATVPNAPATAPARAKGRPKKSAQAAPPAPAKKKRNLSPEGRARIAEAVKRRWAAQKKA